jgi:putative ABC transport system ATP-binding protein
MTTTPTISSFPRATAGVAARTVDATKCYGARQTEVTALDHVNVEFAAHRFTAIMGPSGSGKSTLMHCAAGLDTLTSGHAYIGDVDLASLSDRELTLLRRDHIGFVFQAFNLVPTLSAEENIALPLALANCRPDAKWMEAIVHAIGMRDRLSHRPAELSGGQQQRVAIARALITRPDVVFADEPTGNLDSRASEEILEFMRRAVDRFGQTIVMVTHDASAAAHADVVVFLADGRIVGTLEAPTRTAVLDRLGELGGDDR